MKKKGTQVGEGGYGQVFRVWVGGEKNSAHQLVARHTLGLIALLLQSRSRTERRQTPIILAQVKVLFPSLCPLHHPIITPSPLTSQQLTAIPSL